MRIKTLIAVILGALLSNLNSSVPSKPMVSVSRSAGDFLVYSSTSPWNTPIPAKPSIHANNVNYLAGLTGAFGSDPTQYTLPVYIISADTPLHSVRLSGVGKEWTCSTCKATNWGPAVQVPIPDDAAPASGTDSQIILWNPSTGDEYEFWKFSGSGSYTARNGYHYNTNWSAVTRDRGPRGGGVPYLAGLIRPWEIAQGHIDHAIAFAYQNTQNSFMWPATSTDGKCSLSTCMPMGTRLQLDPALDVNKLGLSNAGIIIAKALQKYGMILIDTSGHPKIYAEYDETANWGGILNAKTVTNIPLTRFRVLDTSLQN